MTASKNGNRGMYVRRIRLKKKRVILRVISSKSMTPKDMLPRNRRIFCHLSEILWVINHKREAQKIKAVFGNGFCEASCHDTVVTSHDGRNHCACNGRHAEIE